MSSVWFDIFPLWRLKLKSEMYYSLLLCVYRLSGWVIARPTGKVRLNAQKAAHLVMHNGWETFYFPAIGQGAYFLGQW